MQPSIDQMAGQLADMARKASDQEIAEGCAWYSERAPELIRDVAKIGGLSYRKAAGVVAVYSINNGWAGNAKQARKIAARYATGKSRPRKNSGYGLPISVDWAWRIMTAERPLDVIGGGDRNRAQKVRSFYRNMIGQYDHATIDRWACRAAGTDEKVRDRRGGYEIIAEAYRCAADEIGWETCELQAVVWIVVRGAAG